MSRLRSWRGRAWPAALLLVLLGSACENPVRPSGEHLEAIDVRLHALAGDSLAATVENGRWEGAPLRLSAGDTLAVRVTFVDFAGKTFTLYGRDDFALRVEAERGGVVGWEPVAEHDRLVGLAAGQTRVRVMIWHVSHPDFISPPLDVVVGP